jgi:hypothetical protein
LLEKSVENPSDEFYHFSYCILPQVLMHESIIRITVINKLRPRRRIKLWRAQGGESEWQKKIAGDLQRWILISNEQSHRAVEEKHTKGELPTNGPVRKQKKQVGKVDRQEPVRSKTYMNIP